MTSPGNSTRIKTRLRNSTFLARNSKNRQSGGRNYHTINHKNNRNCAVTRSNSLKNNVNVRHMNNINKNQDGYTNNNGNDVPSVGNLNSIYRGKFAR